MYQIKELMRDNKSTDNFGFITVIPPYISTNIILNPNCSGKKFNACQLAYAIKHNPIVINRAFVPEKKRYSATE